jgi:hypothetical protein
VFAPLNVNEPVPAFVSENAPPNTPLITTLLATVSVVADVIVPAPVNVSTPFRVAFPNVWAPPIVKVFAIVRALPESLEITAPFITKVPKPNAASFPT